MASEAFQFFSFSHQSMECFQDLKLLAGISRRHFSGAADEGTLGLAVGACCPAEAAMRANPGTSASINAWFISLPCAPRGLTALAPGLLMRNLGEDIAGVTVTAPCGMC